MHPALRTPLCDLLGIEIPIAQAGMGYVARGELCAAVSEAGALGVIGAASLSPKRLREEIRKVRDRTDRPFGVDILFATIGRPERGEAEARFTREIQGHIDVVFEERVPVLISGLGNPGPVVAKAHDQAMVVMSLVGNTHNAVRVAQGGVDVIIAQGYDGGGHTGRVGTLALLPAVIDAVDVPVMAAGGIADGRGLAAALAMGAVGVWMGTRFVASDEADGHVDYKRRIVEIDDEGTTRTRCFSGKPCRVIKNQTTEAWEAPELQARIQRFPQQVGVVSEWLGEDPYRAGRHQGKTEIGALAAGQSSVLIHEVLPAGEIVRGIVREADAALARLAPAARPEGLQGAGA
ncbi:MAG: nitronate monooxygenase [Myxococcales bacterium]|nr:nitronate monooxygenase [Myxococcales bacterium]